MDAFKRHCGLVAAFDRADVDTDLIIPKQFLKSISRSGFGPYLFDGLRYLDEGSPGQDCTLRAVNPDFFLNAPRYHGATVLLARRNFGCGSSREHAVWALANYGFRCIIAPSFADIFFANCCRNGLLPLVLDEQTVDGLFAELAGEQGYRLDVSLEEGTVTTPSGRILAFDIDPMARYCLVNGLDHIGLSLEQAEQIRSYETRRMNEAPWLFEAPPL